MPYLSLALAAALTAGIVCGVAVDLGAMWVPSLTLALGWLAALLSFARGWRRAQFTSSLIGASAAGWLLGSSAVDRALHPPLRILLEQRHTGFAIGASGDARLEEPVTLEGRLRSDATPTEAGATLRIDVERVWLGPCPEATAGGISVGVSGGLHAAAIAQWRAGRVVRAPVLLRRPARYLNWGLADQERAMARRGVALVGTIKSASLVDVVARGRSWEEAAAAVRAATRAAMARHVAPVDLPASAIATALLIGDRAAIDPEVERRLQEAGTYHVIAISGGNIAILAGLVLGGLSWLRVGGRIAALATIVVLAAYAVVASGGASVARATLMATLYLAVRLIDQRTAAANSVALSGSVLLLLNPLAISDVGFWLTFGATSAILIGVSRIRIPPQQLKAALLMLLVSSVCAELALAPVGAFAFQRVTIAGLLLNFAAIPCMTVVQLAAMILVLVDTIGAWWLAARAADLVRLGTFGLIGSAALLDVAPWLTWRVTSPGVVTIASYYAAIAVWFAASRSRLPLGRHVARAAVATAFALFLWIVSSPAARVRAQGDGRLHLTMIDVGQGDAMLVTLPNGRTLVVDTGGVTVKGDFDIGDRVVGPVLRARQLLRLDYLAVTHGDPDHLGGARALVPDFGPAEIWWGVPVAHHDPSALLRAEADRVRAAWRTLQRGDRLAVGGVELRVHHPPPPDWERQKVRNNDSLVLELRFGAVSLLLTGDIGREVEEELLSSLDLLPTVVLKVPHHGSATSSSVAFVEKLQPAAALIGVGRSNAYGHPIPFVLDRYRQTGTEIFRTDQDGQIELSTDGVSVGVRTFTGRTWDSRRDRHEGTKVTKENTKDGGSQ